MSLDTLLITMCPSKTLIRRDGRTALDNYISKIVQKTSKTSGAILIPSQMLLKVVKSAYIRGGTNLTLENYCAETENI